MLYLANSSQPDIAAATHQLADILKTTQSRTGLTWHYEPMPAETHQTIYHPAALHAFRMVFNPATQK
ncbi:hypothetical protein [Hymenobacter cavernae]|uniref:Uncharacterized protein n=1 Tax=Hymenobacter cavernae TaxID=2044852 RepID=A0ABQ1UN10_9BACT|nr:hypothetical protein [Hymenobacter cavernae]GGF23032.1 hypothetical protein GCM10011383_38340 [Hymenobacter cavernae]